MLDIGNAHDLAGLAAHDADHRGGFLLQFVRHRSGLAVEALDPIAVGFVDPRIGLPAIEKGGDIGT